MKKNKRTIPTIVFFVVLVVAFIIGLVLNVRGGLTSPNLDIYVKNTKIGDKTFGYILDLRIYGTYNETSINKIVRIDNYKNTDKRISLMGVSLNALSGINKIEYIVKDNKYYKLTDNKLEEVLSLPYQNTDIYLKGVSKATSITEEKIKNVGNEEYTVYTGKVDKSVINEMLSQTDLDIKVSKDSSCEIWLTKDKHVYKVYYKIDDLTIYPLFFSYNKTREINLDMYK